MQKSVKLFGPLRQGMMQAVGRRHLLKQAGGFLGAGGALAALALPAMADESDNEIDGLWQSVVSAKDNSFPPFKAFELYGGGLWIGSGQTDLTPAALETSLWAVFSKSGPRTYRGTGRFWTYSPTAVATGFGAVVQTTTLSADGRTYHGQGTAQFFDNNGVALGPPTIILDNGVRIA